MGARSKAVSLAWVAAAYVAAALAAWGAALTLPHLRPVWIALAADVAATVVVFIFSAALRNASVYDPYWSVVPPFLAAYAFRVGGGALDSRTLLVLTLVGAWAVRLTWNWLLRWRGLGDEDWRYRELRAGSGRWYPLVNFAGIHLFPTLLVFTGCLALFPALAVGGRPFNGFDLAATVVTSGAIWIEARADRELRAFLREAPERRGVLDRGLWGWSRHPNYFGEVAFWWGLWLFALAADPGWWWTVAGPLAMTALFLFYSVPAMDRRMLARDPQFAARMRHVSGLVPWGRFPK